MLAILTRWEYEEIQRNPKSKASILEVASTRKLSDHPAYTEYVID